MIDPVVSIRIEPEYEGEYKGYVRVQFNDDEGQYFYLDGIRAHTELLRERIARLCLSAWVDEHKGRKFALNTPAPD